MFQTFSQPHQSFVILLAPLVAVEPWYMINDALHWLFQAILMVLILLPPLSHIFKFHKEQS